ncbi:MAG: ParB/RepB/Spo0J family partition protein [Candidatus Saccharibacteria bacterium]|nr:ParB/RepB/Spo0J family partition protein [Candidatus Saccharibacteria bacterium]
MVGLGKGFGSLIPTDFEEGGFDEAFDTTAEEDSKSSKLVDLSIKDIGRDENQPRKEFDPEALEALASSIKEHGIVQPLVVVKAEGIGIDGKSSTKYKIVAGERRWRAADKAGLKKLPAIVRTLDAQNQLELSIIENAQREDLNAIELATAYAKLKEQFNLDADKIAARVGKKKTSVINTMRLLSLPTNVKQAMIEHGLTEGVMRPLVGAEPELIDKVLPMIITEGWSARKVEQYMAANKKKSSVRTTKVHHYLKQEEALSTKYSARVRVHGRSITFACKTDEELERLLGRF